MNKISDTFWACFSKSIFENYKLKQIATTTFLLEISKRILKNENNPKNKENSDKKLTPGPVSELEFSTENVLIAKKCFFFSEKGVSNPMHFGFGN